MKKTKSQRQFHKDFLWASKAAQLKRILAVLMANPNGCTSMDIIRKANTTSPHKRMSELRAYGFDITKAEKAGNGMNYYRLRI